MRQVTSALALRGQRDANHEKYSVARVLSVRFQCLATSQSVLPFELRSLRLSFVAGQCVRRSRIRRVLSSLSGLRTLVRHGACSFGLASLKLTISWQLALSYRNWGILRWRLCCVQFMRAQCSTLNITTHNTSGPQIVTNLQREANCDCSSLTWFVISHSLTLFQRSVHVVASRRLLGSSGNK